MHSSADLRYLFRRHSRQHDAALLSPWSARPAWHSLSGISANASYSGTTLSARRRISGICRVDLIVIAEAFKIRSLLARAARPLLLALYAAAAGPYENRSPPPRLFRATPKSPRRGIVFG